MVAAGGTTTSGFRLAAHAMAASTKQTCARILCVLVVLCTLTAGQLEQYDLTLTVREDVSIGTVVGVVEGDKYSPPYSRLIKNPATDNMTLSSFDVDLSNGRITTKDTLDREEREKHTIIISTFSQPTQLVIVEVRLLDINDITPTFINPSLVASIPESAPRTHKIALGSVRDEDLGDNSTQTVEIVSGNDGNTFFLQIKNSSNVDKILDLVVNTDHLDFEGKKVYNLVIRATDGGGRSSDMQVTIRILDTNDNEPIFNNSKYSARVAENVTVGTSIIQVEATDSDSEENSRITYSIDPKTDPEEYFSIDPRTGWVKVRKPLDFETKPQFVLTLEATDSGSPPLSGSTGLDIIVVNINEQPANISMTFKPDFRNGHVSEDTPVDTVVAVVTIDDPDTDVVRNVEVSLYGGEGYFQLIKTNRLEGNELDLVVLDSLDRETVPAYEMTIVVTDVGTPPLSANREFRITVEDVNDNDPVFLRSKYSADVEETAEIGKSVLKVSATDDDFGDNARITYRIQDGSSHMGWFTVDSSTGVVTTRASVDCELSPQLLVIVATDGGNPPRMATAQVSISIRDVNDKEPEFETSFYSIKIAEDRRVGDCVLTVSAIDPECGASAPVTYRMARMLAPLREFRVDALTGDICVQAALDYELTTSYQFQVEAVDAGNLTSQAVVQVEVKDVNDNHPRFEPNRYPINVVSGVAPGPLITVQARDLDSGHFGTATYSIIYGNDQGFFSVNADTGAVSLDQQLPPGERVFRLHVLATDGGGLTSPDPAQVTVSVISGAVHPPVFSPTMFNFSVAEDALPGRVVGQVQATLDDTGGNSEISYSITFQTESWFQVNSSTGKITTSGQLDRERHAFVVLNVQAQAHFPHVYAVAQVNVSIQDVNDNAPSFPPTAMLELEVREDEAPGTPLYVARARDLDTQNNGVIVYQLQKVPGNLFSINDQTGEITLMDALDYEKHKEYQVLVMAKDMGSPSLNSSMNLTVKVKDINDNDPVFDKAVYDFHVAENVEIGHVVDQVLATDDDSDHNGRISYSFVDDRHASTFGISLVEGKIWTRDLLDREIHDRFEMIVQAVDHGSPQRSATVLVRIIVTDINDNAPEFSREEYRFSIEENLPANSLVGKVVAVDRDSGNNSRLEYFFSGPQTNFTINPQNGEIRTRIPLDRELVASHVLTVYVSDSATEPKTAKAKVKVSVVDDNDNQPVFQRQGPFSESVSENRPKGTEVTTLVALDYDQGDNGLVTYFFDTDWSEPEALENFAIHPRSGKVTTKEVLDYEVRSTYQLRVVAQDGGSEPRQAAQLLTISVLDANDQAPLFHARNVDFDCVENVSVGTVVGRVEATDRDSGNNGKVSYYLVGGNVFSSFSVNRSSGVIQTVREIDYEESSSHTLSIQAYDNSAALPRSSNITVTINVIDVNDNAPQFEQDPVIIRTVAENTRENHVVHTFIATDRDSDVNGTVRYTIESYSGEEEGLGPYFSIDALTGQLYVSGHIDFEKVDQISVIVRAEDMCPDRDHRLHSLMTTIVYVTDINDNAPEFESTDQLTVSEEEAVGFMILVVVAVDADADVDNSGNNRVRYSIVSGNRDGKFLLGEDSGYLTIYDALDHETQASYTLNISAEDSGTPKQVSHQLLHITVADVNDNPPIFVQSVYHANISENASPPTHVVTIQATDADTGVNGELRYSIPSGIAEDEFVVEPITGAVNARMALDREKRDLYTVTAYVQDGAYPVHYSSCTILITVVDENDNRPRFKSQTYTVQVPENRVRQRLLSVVASDDDLGENGRITYEISNDYDGKFSIDPEHGHLSSEPLDRDTTPSYKLIVSARDHGSNPHTATATVEVIVLDENDNSPTFTKSVYTGRIREDVGLGEVVVKVSAHDPDLGPNGAVMYSLGNDTEGFFEIDSATGEIHTSGSFDRERNQSFSFLIVASDNGTTGPRNSSAQVDVTVTDVNDNAPVFSEVPYTSSLSLTTPTNKLILTVNATDRDLGLNGQVEYRLQAYDSSRDSLQYFRIDPTSGRVYTNKSLLLTNAAGHHSLLVVATDSAASPSARLSSTGVIEITVGSESSEQFKFTRSEYTVEIDESLGQGQLVTEVQAGFSGQTSTAATYSFATGNENNAFSMERNTGQIRVQKSELLDYDTNPQIRLIVSASSGSHHAYATLWVNLKDINDNAPRFSQSRYVSAIWENNQPETFVTQVTARDADSGLNGLIDYYIIGGGEKVFVIQDSLTGIVQTHIEAAPLDREARPEGYRLTIQARDRGTPPKTGVCTLLITIVDENDSPPHFPDIGPLNVSENRDVGYVVAMATANDVDLNPILVYDFTTDGNPDQTFSLERSTGRLTLAKRLDHEKKSHYTVRIQVTDGKPDHTQDKWLDVYVDDENDNPPVFSQQSYEVSLPEQTGPQQSVVTVLATDADSGRNKEITYSMAATAVDSFYINSATGVIYTNRTISFTSGESIIQLVVVARDGGSPQQSSMVAVHIQITDVNKFTPRFLNPSGYEAHISESAQKGHLVLQVTAIDEDNAHRGDNINYTLVGTGSEHFHIRQRTGHIYYSGGIDYELRTRYDLTAFATDRGTPPKNSSVPVTIIVDDENDNAPVFVQERYSITLPEDYPPLKEFLRVNATDADSGLNGELRYSITSGNSEGIFINRDNQGGLVIMEQMHLDYESHTSHRLILRVVDCYRCNQSAPRLSAFVTVDIFVTDVSESKPLFPMQHYEADLPENSPRGTVVFRAHANHGDRGDAGRVTYEFLNEFSNEFSQTSQKFEIRPLSGDVRALYEFDFENPNLPHLYNLTISARDTSGNLDVADVTIRVVDMDEFDPLLTAQEYNFEVPGSAKAGDYIGHVSATDLDEGAAGRRVYSFLEPSDYFTINEATGNITVAVTLHDDPPPVRTQTSRRKRALTSDTEHLTIQVSSGQPGSRVGTAQCSITIDRSCPGCAAPVGKLRADEGMDGGVLAGIIVGCIVVIIITIAIILFFIYRRRSPRKAVPNYSSDSTLDLEPPPQLPHDRTFHGDVIRINRPPQGNHLVSDISDQSHNSASSGRGSAEAEEEDEEISRINSSSFLHSSQAFRQKAMPDSGIQHDDDTLSEPTAQTHQEYLANLGIDSSKIGKTKSSNNTNNKQLGRSAESMHQFSDEGGGEGGVDTDFEKMTDLETDDEAATLEARTQGMSFHEPDTANVGSLSSVVNSEEVNSGSYNWDYLIDWGPQYQPLAHVFSEIAKLKDESITPKKQPIKTVPQRQFSSSLKQPQVRTVPPPIITNAPPMSVSLPSATTSNPSSGEAPDYAPPSPPVPATRRGGHPMQKPHPVPHHNHHHHNHHHHHLPHTHAQHPIQQMPLPPIPTQQAPLQGPGITSHLPLSQPNTSGYSTQQQQQQQQQGQYEAPPPAYNQLYNPAYPKMGSNNHHHHHHNNNNNSNNVAGVGYPHPNNSRSPQVARHHHHPHHSPNVNKHNHFHQQQHHHHPPPPQHPPPQPPSHQQQQQSSSGSRSHPVSGHASTMNTSLPSLPRSPISYESSLTSAAMTPSLTPSLSPLATRSPSISPVVSSGHTTPGKSSSRQNLTKRSSNSQSISSTNSEKEFTI